MAEGERRCEEEISCAVYEVSYEEDEGRDEEEGNRRSSLLIRIC